MNGGREPSSDKTKHGDGSWFWVRSTVIQQAAELNKCRPFRENLP